MRRLETAAEQEEYTFEASEIISQMYPDDQYEVIDLPAGDVGTIDIDYNGDQTVTKLSSAQWLNKGKRGVILRGKGVEGPNATHLRPTGYNRVALSVGPQSGHVILQGVRAHVGWKAVYFGGGSHSIPMGQRFVMDNCYIDGQDPEANDGQRGKWGTHLYNVDLHAKNTVWNCPATSEHPNYEHGSAGIGTLIEDCEVMAAGAEGLKKRTARWLNEPGNDPECGWAGRDQVYIVKRTQIRNWFQEWSDRGGAGIVLQGSNSHVWIELVELNPAKTGHENASAALRAYAIAISSENEYTMDGGWNVEGDAQGFVTIKNSAMCSYGRGNSDYTNKIVRVASTAPKQRVCQALVIDGCGIFGENMHVELEQRTAGKYQFPILINGNNSDRVREYCKDKLGMAVDHEAQILKGGKKPLSQDWSYPG